MKNDLMAGMVERLVHNMRNRTKDVGEQVHARPVSDYTDPGRHAREVDILFRAHPIVLAHSSQIPHVGDFVTIDHLGPPVLIVRTAAGGVAAYLNVCPHRSAIVESEPCGNRAHFMCPYHNWMFDLDGRVLKIPDQSSFAGLDPATTGLRPVAVAERLGLIFVRLADGPAIDLDAYLAPVADDLVALRLGEHRHFSSRLTPLRCNWKVMVEGSLETYHFNGVHGTSIAGLFAGMAGMYDLFDRHIRWAVPRKTLLDRHEAGADVRNQVLPNYFIFPNTVLTFPHDHMTLTQVFPNGVGACVFHNVLLTLDGVSRKDDAYWTRQLDLTEGVNDEDFVVIQGIQKAYETAPAKRVIHGRYEQGITNFHAACDRALALGTAE